jgi:hypothetical protein
VVSTEFPTGSVPGLEYFVTALLLAAAGTAFAFGGIITGLVTSRDTLTVSYVSVALGLVCELLNYFACEANLGSQLMTSAILSPPLIFGSMSPLIARFRKIRSDA